MIIPVTQPVHDRGFETADAVEATAANGLTGNDGEPTFNQVEPRRAGWGEVQLHAGMRGEPLLYCRVLVRSVVIANQMQIPLRVMARQRREEGDELDMGMTREAASMDLATLF